MYVTFGEDHLPVLKEVIAGTVMHSCKISFRPDKDGQLVIGSGSASVVVSVPGLKGRQRYNNVPLRKA